MANEVCIQITLFHFTQQITQSIIIKILKESYHEKIIILLPILLCLSLPQYAVAQSFKETKKLAEQGLAIAQGKLGYMYKNGQGVIENYTKAFYWYQKAAEQGHAGAQYNLGAMYASGNGVSTNAIKTYAFILMAQANGYDSSKIIEALKSEMTSAQIAQAQSLAGECYDSDYKNCGDLFQ